MSCTIHDVCLGDCANRDRPTCSHISRDLTGRCFACGHVDDAIRADQAAADARHREYAKTAPVNRTAPPAPRRPVAGWAGTADRMVLRVGAMRAVAIGAMRPWWDVTRHINARHEAPFSVVDEGDAPTLEAAQLAAEDALLAVLTDAARVLGKRVVS